MLKNVDIENSTIKSNANVIQKWYRIYHILQAADYSLTGRTLKNLKPVFPGICQNRTLKI